ncbi:MAG: hypothetical protein M5U08_07480 [Burkholderiales bacterium]|nr:hypothetical protein [Burkholderiales bacterium]
MSYYGKGGLIALCLDLTIRRRTRGRKSLDDVMRALWAHHGRAGIGVPEDGVERLAEAVTGLRLHAFFERALRTTAELPLAPLLRDVGLALAMRPAESATDRGGKPAAAEARTLAAQASLGARSAGEAPR